MLRHRYGLQLPLKTGGNAEVARAGMTGRSRCVRGWSRQVSVGRAGRGSRGKCESRQCGERERAGESEGAVHNRKDVLS